MADAECKSRRKLLLGLLACGVVPATFIAARARPHMPAFVSAEGAADESFGLGSIFSEHSLLGSPTSQAVPTSFRGHGLAQHPKQTHLVVMMGRRPSQQAMVVDVLTQTAVAVFQSPSAYIFEGHACFSFDGDFLFTSESLAKNGEGRVGIYRTDNWLRVGEWSSYGVGPHELKLMPALSGNSQLVVANGGIFSRERKPQNLESMQSSLAIVDANTGELLAQHKVQEPKASLRHIDVASDGSVAVAMQVQRSVMHTQALVPLAATLKPGGELTLLPEPEQVISRLQDYMGSVAIHNASRTAGFTSPKGDLAVFWNIDSGEFKGYHAFHDVCGVSVSQDQNFFVLSNSAGHVRQLSAATLKEDVGRRVHFAHRRWDNHMLTLRV